MACECTEYTGQQIRQMLKKILIAAGWLVIWQLAALLIDNTILMAGPIEVASALAGMVCTEDFWASLAFSFLRIAGGFLCGSAAGILLAYLAYRRSLLREILAPLVTILKTAPIASFIILALIWFGSSRISFVISLIVVFPMLYLNTMEGLQSIDGKLLEMADVYRIPSASRLRCIELPAVIPFLTGAFRLALGMSWRSGVAAELIGQYKLSIGNQLYMDKITLDTAGILAWTFVIILVSWLFEKVFLWLFGLLTSPVRGAQHNTNRPAGTDAPQGGAAGTGQPQRQQAGRGPEE